MPAALTQDLPARLAHAAQATGLLAPGDGVLVAVSAGRDSTALACLLAAARTHLPLDLVLGHVDHGWRGAAEAAADRAAVVALGQRLSLPMSYAGPPPADTPHTEDAARRHRYHALGTLARAHGLTAIATGHHAGDQAETILMRLLRGSGLVGLTGIPPQRPLGAGDLRVVRPLLEVDPHALHAWLTEHGVPWRDDPTNADLRRDRARIRERLRLRPPAARRNLAALAARLRGRLSARLAMIDRQAATHFEHLPYAQAIAMPRRLLTPLRGEDLALALRRAGEPLAAGRDGPWFTRRHVARLEALLLRGGALDLPRGLRVHVSGHTAWLARRCTQSPGEPPTLTLKLVDRAAFHLEAWRAERHPGAAAVDAARLGAQPTVRWLAEGDRFAPLGGSGRRVSARAWLSRQGVPAFVRRAQPVVAGRSGVAWIVGRRVDHAHAIGPTTRQVAILRVGPPS